MKKYLMIVLASLFHLTSGAAEKDSTVYFNLHDSVKAIQFLSEINVQSLAGKKEVYAGIRTDLVSLSLEAEKDKREFSFEFPENAVVTAKGFNTNADEKGEIEWAYNWAINETCKLLLSVATDSAENFSLYSGYVWLPKENKWKLIGTCKIKGRWSTLQQPAFYYSTGKKQAISVTTGQVWVQRNTGSWLNMKADNQPNPVIMLSGHSDSLQQRQADIQQIEEAIASGRTDVKNNAEGVYYTILKEGTGRLVSLNDTVVVHYKGYLFENNEVFDQTKDKPASFPLKRLIRGWQVGVPLCRIGGKIKLVIPSDMAYGIRTRAAKIPPNSILVFEVEVVDTKAP